MSGGNLNSAYRAPKEPILNRCTGTVTGSRFATWASATQPMVHTTPGLPAPTTSVVQPVGITIHRFSDHVCYPWLGEDVLRG